MLLRIYISLFFVLLSTGNTSSSIKWLKTTSSGLMMSWRNCGSSSDPVQLKNLIITPDPIRIPGNLTIDCSVDIACNIPTNVHASLLLERKVGPFFIKVPCVNNFGSCNYPNICLIWAQVCLKYLAQYGLPCQCPIPPNIYSISNANIFINKNLPQEFLGEYRAKADFGSNEGHLGCVNIDLTITK